MREIIQRARHANLSQNVEKHIRKHYKDFGFESREEFTREKIIKIAQRISKTATHMFLHQSKYGDAIIFFDGQHILIVDRERNSIKAIFAVIDEEYIRRKLQRNF